nr:MAG TPA: nucelotide kinase [Caudoviricetes sp.]
MEIREINDKELSEAMEKIVEKITESFSTIPLEMENDDSDTADRAEKPAADAIHHPDHYTWKGVECKDIIEAMTEVLTGIEAYYTGNIVKYLYRYPKKGTLVQDLRKAAQYVDFLLEHFEGMEENHD